MSNNDDVSYAQAKKEFEDANYQIGNLDNFFQAVTGQKKTFTSLPSKNSNELEPEGFSMLEGGEESFENSFLEKLSKTASVNTPSVNTDEPKTTQEFELTENQKTALANYPGLVDYIGQADEEIVDVIGEALNGYITKNVAQNSYAINKAACMCKTEGKALKQYFQYPDTVGCVTVEGKFTGKEYIHHKKAEQECLVLVKRNEKFYNVSKNFNINFSFASTE